MNSQPRFHRVPYQSQKTIQTDFGFQQLLKNPCSKKRLRKGLCARCVTENEFINEIRQKRREKKIKDQKEKEIRKKSVKKKKCNRKRWKSLRKYIVPKSESKKTSSKSKTTGKEYGRQLGHFVCYKH